MLRAYSVDQVRRAEAALIARLPPGALMQRAAVGLAAECVRLLGGRAYGSRVLAIVGSGDNGGDALFALAWLARRGATVEAVLLDPARAHAEGLAALRAATGRASEASGWTPPAHADLILDGVTGIGGRGGLRPAAQEVFAKVETLRPSARVVAVDLPSGVESDSGEVTGPAVRADVTITFGAHKPGLLVSPGATHAGEVRFVDIGLAPFLDGDPVLEALEAADVAALRPVPDPETNKYRRGVVGVMAGSIRYPGAAVLAVGSALRSGAGAVRYVGPREVGSAVLAQWPETMVSHGAPDDAGRVQAWVVGPGIGVDDTVADRVGQVLALDLPTLVDADGLTGLARLAHSTEPPQPPAGRPTTPGRIAHRTEPILVTPHAGEAARLLSALGADWSPDEIESRRMAAVRELAEHYQCTALLKGSTTLIAEPHRTTIRVNPTGTPALATAGSGDVLSGLGGGLLAAGLSPFDAAGAAAWLHGEAARVARASGASSIIAGDLIGALRSM